MSDVELRDPAEEPRSRSSAAGPKPAGASMVDPKEPGSSTPDSDGSATVDAERAGPSTPEDTGPSAPEHPGLSTVDPASAGSSTPDPAGSSTHDRAGSSTPDPDRSGSSTAVSDGPSARFRPTTADEGYVPWHTDGRGPDPTADGPVTGRLKKAFVRTAAKSWGDSLFGMSAQAAFWSALSTAPMLLALLGLIGPVASLFGPNTIAEIEAEIDQFLNSIFNPEVADGLIGNTIDTILRSNQGSAISVGLVISLWAGSSAMAAFVESIAIAYGQHEVRHPIKERFFALLLYLIALVSGILLLPLLAIGPRYLIDVLPVSARDNVSLIIQIGYFPTLLVALILLLTTLYKVAPKHRHQWKRGLPGAVLAAVLFIVLSTGLRIYLGYVYEHGLTYGALATPITFLLFYYFSAMAVIIGAQFNNALLEYYPPRKVTGRTTT